MELSIHVNHYGARSGFLYYKLTIPHGEGTPYLPPGDELSSSVCFESWEPFQDIDLSKQKSNFFLSLVT
jgi:hypothetical protein